MGNNTAFTDDSQQETVSNTGFTAPFLIGLVILALLLVCTLIFVLVRFKKNKSVSADNVKRLNISKLSPPLHLLKVESLSHAEQHGKPPDSAPHSEADMDELIEIDNKNASKRNIFKTPGGDSSDDEFFDNEETNKKSDEVVNDGNERLSDYSEGPKQMNVNKRKLHAQMASDEFIIRGSIDTDGVKNAQPIKVSIDDITPGAPDNELVENELNAGRQHAVSLESEKLFDGSFKNNDVDTYDTEHGTNDNNNAMEKVKNVFEFALINDK